MNNPGDSIAKEKYRILCKSEPSIPVFSRDWWLDAACGKNNWDVVIVEDKQEKIIASLPYLFKKKMGRTIVSQPPLTQKLGPWIFYKENIQYAKKIGYENEVMSSLIDQLPSSDWFLQGFHHEITNWLAFYWKGFDQKTAYSYIIRDISDPEAVLQNFSRSKKKDINKAKKQVNICFDLSAKDFYENHKLTLSKQGRKISYTFEHFNNLYQAGYKNNSAKTIYATDENGNLHGALFVIWDENSAYDLISTIDPDHRNSGAATLLIIEIIKYLSDKTKSFDFEGSMIKGVEFSFRQFGTEQVPMFFISKTNSKLIALYNLIRNEKYRKSSSA